MLALSRAMLCVTALLSACSWSAIVDPPLDPSQALVDVNAALNEIGTLPIDEPERVVAWARAYDRFERDLEPQLRDRVGPVDVARAEYAFGKVLDVVQNGRDPQSAIDGLQRAMSDLMDGLAPAVAAR